MGIAEVLAIIAAVGVAASAAGTGVSAWQSEENFRQMDWSSRYGQWANIVQMYREDNAIQRRVADLKKAGLSPVLAAGSAAQAAPIRTPAPPQRTFDASMINNLGIQLGDLILKSQVADATIQQKKAQIDQIKAKTAQINTLTPSMKTSLDAKSVLNINQSNKVQYETLIAEMDALIMKMSGFKGGSTAFGGLFRDLSVILGRLKYEMQEYNKKNKGSSGSY